MVKEELISKAKIILEKVHDAPGSLGFHCKAILLLGFQLCFDLAALAIDMGRQGKLKKSSPARYYNGCVRREVGERGLRW